MAKLKIALEIDLTDSDDLEADVENILQSVHDGLVCRPLELLVNAIGSEPKRRKAMYKGGSSKESADLYFNALKKSYREESLVMKRLWESRKIEVVK